VRSCRTPRRYYDLGRAILAHLRARRPRATQTGRVAAPVGVTTTASQRLFVTWIRRRPLVAIGAAAVTLVASVTLGNQVVDALVAVGVGATVLSVPRHFRLGIFLGVAIAAGIDALPGPDLDAGPVFYGLYVQSYIVLMLWVALVIAGGLRGLTRLLSSATGRTVMVLCLSLLAWWTYTLYRTNLQGIGSIRHAVSFGRDFLTYAVTVPLVAIGLQRREVRDVTLLAAACLAMIAAGGYIASSLGHHTIALLVHSSSAREVSGVTRVFTPGEDLFSAALALGFGACLLGPSQRVRRIGTVVTVISLIAVVSELTRAQYVGSGAGLLAAACVWLRGSSAIVRSARRRLGIGIASTALVVSTAFIVSPHGGLAARAGAAATRLTSITSAVSTNSPSASTVAVRVGEASLLEQRLGAHAFLGLGFIDPRDQYDPSLPYGSIRNSDVGILNVVMTMGIVGAVLYYLPLLCVGAALSIVGWRGSGGGLAWVGLGCFAWCVAAVVTSPTLVTLFSPTGVVSAAAVLGLGVVVVLESETARP
jgi:hypothetical protein